MTTVRLSNLQYPMLQVFADAGSGYYMTIEEAQTYDQRPFRSMLMQKWVVFRPGRGFHITREGRDAWRDYHSRDIQRAGGSFNRPLTAYFDPTAYGLKIARKDAKRAGSIHEMPKRNTA